MPSDFLRKRLKLTGMLLSLYQSTSWSETMGLDLGRPEIMLGPLPIYNIENIGHASSDEMLKYRSMSGIYLAHQKGGNKTFKFRGKIWGPTRYWIYTLLEVMQQQGLEEMKKIGNLIAYEEININNGIIDADMNKDLLTEYGKPTAQNRGTLHNYQPYGELSEQKYPYHKTFPIITETRVYMFMYIETLRMEQNVKFGKDVIEIDVLCRHYMPPTDYNATKPEDDEDDDVGKQYYRTYTNTETMKRFRRGLIALNLGNIISQVGRDGILDDLTQNPYGSVTKDQMFDLL